MNKFQQGIADHKKVIHEGLGHKGLCEGVTRNWPERDTQGRYDKTCPVCREESFIKKLSYNTLQSVCSECFGIKEN